MRLAPNKPSPSGVEGSELGVVSRALLNLRNFPGCPLIRLAILRCTASGTPGFGTAHGARSALPGLSSLLRQEMHLQKMRGVHMLERGLQLSCRFTIHMVLRVWVWC